jgi:hypothetical protein
MVEGEPNLRRKPRPNRKHRQSLRVDFRKSESPWLSIEVKPEIASLYGCYLPFGLYG